MLLGRLKSRPGRRAVVARQGKYPAKIPYNVVEPLAELLKENPDLPYKSVNDAIKHAVAHFTEYLREKTIGSQVPSEDSLVDELSEVLRRHKRREAPKKKP